MCERSGSECRSKCVRERLFRGATCTAAPTTVPRRACHTVEYGAIEIRAPVGKMSFSHLRMKRFHQKR